MKVIVTQRAKSNLFPRKIILFLYNTFLMQDKIKNHFLKYIKMKF